MHQPCLLLHPPEQFALQLCRLALCWPKQVCRPSARWARQHEPVWLLLLVVRIKCCGDEGANPLWGSTLSLLHPSSLRLFQPYLMKAKRVVLFLTMTSVRNLLPSPPIGSLITVEDEKLVEH